MQRRTPLLCLALAAVALAAAGSASRAETPQAPKVVVPATAADTPPAGAVSPAPRVDSDPATWSACAAPSVLRLHAADDAREVPAVDACGPGDAWAAAMDRDQAAAAHCDSAGRRVDMARVLEGALPLDAATAAHVRAVHRAGQKLGRHADAVGLVG